DPSGRPSSRWMVLRSLTFFSRLIAMPLKTIQKTMRSDQRILSLGAWLWLMGLVIIPLSYVIVLSFLTRGPYGGVIFEFNLNNFAKLLELEYGVIVSKVLVRSVTLAFVTTVLCALAGYPLALFLVFKAGRYRPLLFMLLIV